MLEAREGAGEMDEGGRGGSGVSGEHPARQRGDQEERTHQVRPALRDTMFGSPHTTYRAYQQTGRS